MLLTISTTHQPATDLGYLLRKNPARVQSFNQSFGVAHVFYPEATSERCTAALLLEVDPVGLVRNRRCLRQCAGRQKQGATGPCRDRLAADGNPFSASMSWWRRISPPFVRTFGLHRHCQEPSVGRQ